jgi:hypothetical protein
MWKLLIILAITYFNTYANETKKDTLTESHIEKQLKKEKKFAQEQQFYMGDDYDLKGAEVDDKSLKNIPIQPDYNDEFDMDDVYD